MELTPQTQETFQQFLVDLMRRWTGTILLLVAALTPMFGVLDYMMMPAEKHELFWSIRAAVTVASLLQYAILRMTPDRWVIIHAYWVSLNTGTMVSYMTTHLGGFESSYYVGLMLIIVGVNLFLPWHWAHGALNGGMVLCEYMLLNFFTDEQWQWKIALDHAFFLGAMIIIAVTMSHYKHVLTRAEWEARTALWGEMEIAKKIQTALLPTRESLPGYSVAVVMVPASEVGGDYYDIIIAPDQKSGWVCIGDVSGHGVSAGLIMMMTQTSVQTTIKRDPGISPSRLLIDVNSVLNENISRLGEALYLTIIALRMRGDRVQVSGKHQDILVHRANTNKVETIPTRGFWLGISKNIAQAFVDQEFKMNKGDTALLFTDGITELTRMDDELYGIERLSECFRKHAGEADVQVLLKKIMSEASAFAEVPPDDDMTLMLLRKT